jgi:osmoprotectant transport system ATP-binding protein
MIEVQKLTRRYGERLAVDGVSFRVDPGDSSRLVGASGSGKTTTLKMINRLVAPSAGRVLVEGEDAATLETHRLRRRIGYVFQGVGLFPHMSVGENVAVPLRLARWEEARARARVTELLALVERTQLILDSLDCRAGSASDSRAPWRVAAIMLLDEPWCAGPASRATAQQSFLELRRRLGLTAVLVTRHEACCSPIQWASNAGRLVQIGTPAEQLRAPADEHVALLLATPRRQARRLDELLGGGA